MNEINENSILHEIEKEYARIDNRWMKLQLYTFIGLVVIGFALELIVGMFWLQTGSVEISTSRYVLKYILAPLGFNLSLVVAGYLVFRSARVPQKAKAYAISLLFVGACFVLYTVHSIFYSLFLIFTIPILLTVVYSDYMMTTSTAVAGILAKTVSDLFVVWDPDETNPLASDFGINNFIISIFIFLIFYLTCVIVIRFEKAKISASIQKEIEYYHAQRRLKMDELTEIYNRTALRQAFSNMERDPSDNTYTFVMIDVDNFKTLNDTFGHTKGDMCLKEFAVILKNNCKGGVLPFRFGGDEFCILFKNTELKNVIDTCRRIQADLKNSLTSANSMDMTASFGISSYEKQMTVSQLLKNTDVALYRAKEARNSICVQDKGKLMCDF